MSTEYLSPDEIAEQLGVTGKTVRDWLRSGELVGIKVGSSWRVHRQDLERYIDGQRIAALMIKAKSKHPETEWIEGACRQCGNYIPEPKDAGNWVCSPSCKAEYDRVAADVVERGTIEFSNCSGDVIPHF